MNEAAVALVTDDVATWLGPLTAACNRFNIINSAREGMFLAQCGYESTRFTVLEENLNYTAAQLLALWPARFSQDDAAAMAHDQEAIAERVYGGRMGNGPEGSGDGWGFRGRGILDTTGKNEYIATWKGIGIDVVTDPALLLDPDTAAMAAAWFFFANGCNALADNGDIEGVTHRINGGETGLADRQALLNLVMPAYA